MEVGPSRRHLLGIPEESLEFLEEEQPEQPEEAPASPGKPQFRYGGMEGGNNISVEKEQ